MRRWVWVGIVCCVAIGAVLGGLKAYQLITSGEEQAVLPSAVVHEFAAPQEAERTFDETYFTMRLPEDWRLKSHSDIEMYNMYTYEATAKNKDNRTVEIYVDKVPTEHVFNRLLPVYIADNRFVVATAVSDNCTTLVGQEIKRPTTITELPVKWQGVPFTCDIAGYIRNVVAVGSPENGLNLPLAGANGTKHTYYFVYIDNNINPDYQILERLITSFTAK